MYNIHGLNQYFKARNALSCQLMIVFRSEINESVTNSQDLIEQLAY